MNNFNNLATLEEVWGGEFHSLRKKNKKKKKTVSFSPEPYELEDEMGPTNYLLNQDQPEYFNQHPFQTDLEREEVFNQPTIVPETINEPPKQKNNNVSESFQENIKLSELEKKIDLILSKINNIDSEPKQENIHDLILFIIFSIFIIFTMDSVYRLGKQTI